MSKRQGERGGCCLPNFLGCCLGFMLLFACVIGIPTALISYLSSGGPVPFSEDYKPSEADAVAYENAFSNAVQQARGESFVLTFTETQFAAWLNLEFKEELAAQFDLEQYSDSAEFQVQFEDGEADIFVGVIVWDAVGFDINSLATLEIAPTPINASANQKLDVTVTEFKVGRGDAPESIQEDLSDAINKAMIELLKPIQDRDGIDYRITSVSIANGSISFNGEVFVLP